MKRAREKDELLRFIWVNSGWGSFWGSTLGQVFTTAERGAWDWIWASTQKDVLGGPEKNNATPTWWRRLDTNRMIARKRRKEVLKWRRVRKSAALCYRALIDFPSAQWRFPANIIWAIMRGEKTLIRGRYEKHENGRSFTRGVDCSGWCWQIETRDDTNWATDLTAIYGDTPPSVQLIQPNWAKMWLMCSLRMTQPTSNESSSWQHFPRIYSYVLRAVWHV